MRLCAIVSSSGTPPEGIVCDVPPEAYNDFADRVTQISVGEFLAILIGFRHFREVFQDGSHIVYTDNMCVLHSIVNGTSKARDLAAFAYAAHVFMASMNAAFWFEWVESHSNIADGGSRAGIDDDLSRQVGIPLKFIAMPALPTGFPFALPSRWRDFFHVSGP